jgi:hypothetical protein
MQYDNEEIMSAYSDMGSEEQTIECHHERNTCPQCQGVTTCRCSAPKVDIGQVCLKCHSSNLTDEKDEEGYDYSCVMCIAEDDLKSKIIGVVDMIPDEVVHPEGKDYEPHITALYGLHSNDFDEVYSMIDGMDPDIRFKIIGLSLFENDEFDVLKFDIESEDMANMNNRLKGLEHTSNFPDYHPHMTLAYILPGMGQQFVLPTALDGKWFTSNQLKMSFSDASDPNFFNLFKGDDSLSIDTEHNLINVVDDDCDKCSDGIYVTESNNHTVKCTSCGYSMSMFKIGD